MLVLNKWRFGSEELLSKMSPELSEGWYFIDYDPSESSSDILLNNSRDPDLHFFNTKFKTLAHH